MKSGGDRCVCRLAVLYVVVLMVPGAVIGAPTSNRDEKEYVFVPATRFVAIPLSGNGLPVYQPLPFQPNQQHTRGPFDFIGNWIQQSSWFPVELNVPDTFANIGNGLSQASQNLGNGFNQFTQGVSQATQNFGNGISQLSQNVGNGVSQFTQGIGNGWNQWSQNFNNWAQNLGQRIPIINNIVRPKIPTAGGGVIVVLPIDGNDVRISGEKVKVDRVFGDDVLESFP